jgi:protein-S-isoprenylcysteine O-methyltransferase Ste14
MDEGFFRVLLGLIFFIFILIWLRSFFLTGFRRSSYFTFKEGIIQGISFRLFLTLSIAGIILHLYNPAMMGWSVITLDPLIRILGIIPALLGLSILVMAIRALGKNFFATLKLRNDHELIQKGPYRFMKHPMYISFILMWICFFLLSANWFIGLTGIITYIIIFLWRVPREEKMMQERFGDKYSKNP